jgi:hypothetical protein
LRRAYRDWPSPAASCSSTARRPAPHCATAASSWTPQAGPTAQTRRSPGLSPSTCLTGDAACPQLEALGDGRVSHLWTSETGQESVVTAGLDTTPVLSAPTDGDSAGRIGAGTGRYVLYNGGSGKQRVDFPWSPVRQRNKPSTWTLTLTNASGKIVRTLTGSSTGAAVRPARDGTSDSGGGTTGGAYTWKLTAHPRDGQGPDLTLSGTMTPG